MRYATAFLILGIIASNANAACVKPVGTYTGSYKGEFTSTSSNGEFTTYISGQMSLAIPAKGNWIPTSWVQGCIEGQETRGVSCYNQYESKSSSSELPKSAGIIGRAAVQGWPGNDTRLNVFDTKTCRGLIKAASGVYISYVVSENGNRLELLYFTAESSSEQTKDMFPIILNKS